MKIMNRQERQKHRDVFYEQFRIPLFIKQEWDAKDVIITEEIRQRTFRIQEENERANRFMEGE